MIALETMHFEHLGQTGLRIDLGDLTVLVDPYLSNSVQDLDSPDLVREVPIPYHPNELTGVDWVLITHEHMDHCDPHTLPVLAEASPKARFMGPLAVRKQLADWGISEERIQEASPEPNALGNYLKVRSVPAAHPKLRFDQYNQPYSVGYLFQYKSKTIYIAGDTSVCDELIHELKQIGSIDLAFLPVNEDNYFRRRRGIIGNMSIREAFGVAAAVGIKSVVPVHWDMFSVNSTSPIEIKAVYDSENWPFDLLDSNMIKL
jgi:L-ascorbate 6-phosphate lactonase